MKEEYRLSRSVGTKVTEAEYQQLLERAGATKMGVWVRDVLLAEVNKRPLEEAVMAQTMATNTIVLNLMKMLATGAKITDQAVRELVKHAEAEKWEKARRELAKTGGGR